MFIICRMVALSVKNDIIQVQTKNLMRVIQYTAFFSFCKALIRKAGDFFIRPNAFFISLSFISFMVFISASAEDVFSGKNIFQDSDSDGLSNEEERLYGTDPFNKDPDGDGYADGDEVKGGYNPLKRAPGDRIVIGGNDPHRPVAPDLERQLPAQFDRLPDERGQKRRFGHQRLDHDRVVVLRENAVQHAIEPCNPSADVGPVKLKRKDGIVPGDHRQACHGVSSALAPCHTA